MVGGWKKEATGSRDWQKRKTRMEIMSRKKKRKWICHMHPHLFLIQMKGSCLESKRVHLYSYLFENCKAVLTFFLHCTTFSITGSNLQLVLSVFWMGINEWVSNIDGMALGMRRENFSWHSLRISNDCNSIPVWQRRPEGINIAEWKET